MMKKILVLLFTLLILASSAFSTIIEDLTPASDNGLSALLVDSYPHSARSLGMGSAGIAVGGRSDSFYMNPALLARRTLISLPYAQVTLYHPYELFQKDSETGSSIIDDLLDAIESGNQDSMVNAGTNFLSMLKSGRGKIAEVEAGITLGGGGFAIGMHVKDTIHTFGEGVGGLDSYLYDELNVNILAALGLRFDITPSISLDVGLSGGVSVLGYTGLIGAERILDMLSGTSESGGDPMGEILNSIPLAFGYYIPLNAGVNLNLPLGFSVGVVGRNLLGGLGIKMQAYEGLNSLIDDPMGIVSDVFSDSADFTIKTDPRMDLGLGWKWENGWFAPTVAFDMVDVIGFFSDDMSLRSFVDHMRVGAEVRLLSFLDVRGGINQGYWTVGAGIDLWAIKIDAAYYWQEFGDTAGDYPLDAFTIRFNIGFDR